MAPRMAPFVSLLAAATKEDMLFQLFTDAYADVELAETPTYTCPYEVKMEHFKEFSADHGYSSFCYSPKGAPTAECSTDEAAKLASAHQYAYNHGPSFVEQAKTYKIDSLFDLTYRMRGDEKYEDMMVYHIEGLLREPKKIQKIEDKLMLKQLAHDAGVETTDMYFGAHQDDFDRGKFTDALTGLCAKGIDGFLMKPTHTSEGNGIQILRKWQDLCKDQSALDAKVSGLADIAERLLATPPHLTKENEHLAGMKHGLIVEELFNSGGSSTRPSEVKVLVLFGKVHSIWFIGSDWRGCAIHGGAYFVHADRTGWHMGGVFDVAPEDEMNEAFMKDYFDIVVEQAESFANKVGADYTRVDFFLGMAPGDPVVVRLNEVETVSGIWYEHSRQAIGSLWRDGYVVGKKDAYLAEMTEDKWHTIFLNDLADRRVLLDGENPLVPPTDPSGGDTPHGSDPSPAATTSGGSNFFMYTTLLLGAGCAGMFYMLSNLRSENDRLKGRSGVQMEMASQGH